MTPVGRTTGAGPRWRAVVVSPHFDDAVLSVGGLLGRLDRPTAVFTVHGGPPAAGLPVSEWDADCGFVSPDEAYRSRLAEDARACALLGAQQVALPQADGPYRNGERLSALEDFLAALHPETEVFVPLGTNQPDHAVVRDTALETLDPDRSPRPRIYADLPYTAVVAGWGGRSVSSALADSSECGLAFRIVRDRHGLDLLHDITLDEQEWCRKRDAIFCYSSQLSPVATMLETRDAGALLRHPGPLGSEFVWQLGEPGVCR